MLPSKYRFEKIFQYLTGLPLILTALFLVSCKSGNRIIKMTKLDDYPSASAITYFNSHYYIMGDDSRNLVILDGDLNVSDSIVLYSSAEKRISKSIKGDMEAITLTKEGKLLLFGSGSISPSRSGGWLIDPVNKRADSIRFDSLYDRFKALGLKVLNIEGACTMPGSVLLANRGNNAWRRNDLVILDEEFRENQSLSPIAIIRLGTVADSSVFNGVSGLDYAAKSDQLFLTVSTENTSSNTGDGTIGKSYLWIVNNISSKKGLKAINPDTIIDLENLDKRFTGQKIESLCVIKETKNTFHLALTADNDDGSSAVFIISISRSRL